MDPNGTDDLILQVLRQIRDNLSKDNALILAELQKLNQRNPIPKEDVTYGDELSF